MIITLWSPYIILSKIHSRCAQRSMQYPLPLPAFLFVSLQVDRLPYANVHAKLNLLLLICLGRELFLGRGHDLILA